MKTFVREILKKSSHLRNRIFVIMVISLIIVLAPPSAMAKEPEYTPKAEDINTLAKLLSEFDYDSWESVPKKGSYLENFDRNDNGLLDLRDLLEIVSYVREPPSTVLEAVITDEQNGVKYTLSSNKKYYEADLSKAFGDIVIAGSFNGIPVTRVVSNDASHYKITSISLPNSIKSIGTNAFRNCINLTELNIPNGVISISEYAFYGCTGLTSITIPDSVTSIGHYAFYNCSSLTSVTIPDGVTSIGEQAFSGCSKLTGITIPDSVTSIWQGAFYGCSSLTSVTIPDGVTSIGSSAFRGCSSLTGITIPDSVTSIGGSAFYGCSNLTSITIPDGVTSIGYYAFLGCSSLTSIYVKQDSYAETWAKNNGFTNKIIYY